jgi:hypothetical protein
MARWSSRSGTAASVQVLDAGGIRPFRTLGRPASKKRQGAKSREAGPAAGSRALWGFQVNGAFDGGATLGDATRMTARRGARECGRCVQGGV